MTILYILSAACFAACANYFLRRNLEKGGTSNAFLSLYFLISLVLAILITPELFFTKLSFLMAILGCCTGFLNFMMMGLTARSLEIGPPGLTFTFQNASCVLPGILLCLLFGEPFGFTLTPWLIASFCIIVSGLYISARTYGKSNQQTQFGKWLVLAVSMLLVQGIILSIFQWRVLLLSYDKGIHWLIPWTSAPEEDIWFMPAFFLIPTICQLTRFWRKEKRPFTTTEWIYGSSAGVFNCLAMLLLLLATKTNGAMNKVILFPLFTVSVILFCNLWGMKIYHERVNWLGIIFCVGGVVLGLIV
jgi:drug/metabolite transporter (DMT)-like permease